MDGEEYSSHLGTLSGTMSDTVEVDGSTGEGGGQVLRLAVALSAATGTPVHVTSIRAGRKNPGLRAQHMAAVKAVAALTDAHVEGLSLGSRELTFEPLRPPSGKVDVDVGTAGSVTLVLQAVLGALSAPSAGPVEITITGGTDVIMAPSWDYLTNVLVPALGRMGMDMELSCERRGFFPKGGGRVTLSMDERTGPLEPYVPRVTEKARIEGTIVFADLPDHIPRRIDHALRKELVDLDVGRIRKKHVEADSPGVVATLWADLGEAIVGASMTGRRGLPSERIGSEMARELLEDIAASATVDGHLADQLVVHAAMAGDGSRVHTREVSRHLRTALDVTRIFTDVHYEID
jgi:RNA 3'-phosphate cyclase